VCEQYDVTLDFEQQKTGCEAHLLHPDLVPWDFKPSDKGVIWLTPEGEIKNGLKAPDVYSSREIVANHKACASPDEFIKTLRMDMGAEIF